MIIRSHAAARFHGVDRSAAHCADPHLRPHPLLQSPTIRRQDRHRLHAIHDGMQSRNHATNHNINYGPLEAQVVDKNGDAV